MVVKMIFKCKELCWQFLSPSPVPATLRDGSDLYGFIIQQKKQLPRKSCHVFFILYPPAQ